MLSTWGDQERSLNNSTPRYTKLYSPLSGSGRARCRNAAAMFYNPGLVLKILHFDGFNDIPHVMLQFSSVDRSFCNRIWSSIDLIGLYTKKSSANRRIVVPALRLLGISLMKRRKSRGPSTVPCGTPESTLSSFENTPSTMTFW